MDVQFWSSTSDNRGQLKRSTLQVQELFKEIELVDACTDAKHRAVEALSHITKMLVTMREKKTK